MEKISAIAHSVADVLVCAWTGSMGTFADRKYQHEMDYRHGHFTRAYAEYCEQPWFDSKGREKLARPTYDRSDYIAEIVVDIVRVIWFGLFPCPHKNWVDTSWGGPDSGAMAGYCPDCGEHHSHILY